MEPKKFLDNAYEIHTDDETLQFYEDWSDSYDDELVIQNNYQQPKRCAEALEKYFPNLDGLVLDIGCGTGLSGTALADKGFKNLHGCDLSPKMLERAKHTEVYQKLFIANLNEPLQAIENASYDAATAIGVFSFGHVKSEAFDEILRVLKTGSPLIIGINDHFFQQGTITSKLDRLTEQQLVEQVSVEFGEHIPGIQLPGWVIVIRKL